MEKAEPVYFSRPIRGLFKDESGATLVLVLVLVTILGLSAGLAGMTWSSLTRRAREADLLWKGNQIRQAIGSYYLSSHGQGAPNIYPSKLEYLLKDPRFLQTKRHLRQNYLDPMTGKDWILIKDQAGRIKGVRSSLEEEPFKQGNFSEADKEFEGRGLYSEWEFIYIPKTTNPAATPPAATGETAVPGSEGAAPAPETQAPAPESPPAESAPPPAEGTEPPQG